MAGSREAAHVGADLGDDHLGAELAHPGDRGQLLDGVTKGSKTGIDLPVNLGDAGIERVDLLQMQPEQETMVPLDAPAWGLHPRPGHERPALLPRCARVDVSRTY